ncbi:trypsin-like serine peptidase [Flavobacterium collinsii]|uniref:Serine protease n=1 Tax=Flavobacterium collinsii TaxID=1114861 RepID=A0A9W4TLF9_9FLAO|nr:serine protease [Flavobacterium collinsii]CAI2768155.1 Serine protease (modular protein) [Flavobacterium collinsii]
MNRKFLILAILLLIGTSGNAQVSDTVPQKNNGADQTDFYLDKINQKDEVEKNIDRAMRHRPGGARMYSDKATSSSAKALGLPKTNFEEQFNPKRLHGPSQYDSRIEIAQLKPAVEWQQAIYAKSESVAMIVEKENLIKISPDIYQLNAAVTLGGRYKLCDGEAFANQIVVGCGTAFIIDKSTMMTAAHVFQRPLKNYAVVFGYRVINSLGTAETGIVIEDVYFPTEITQTYSGLDIVKFKTDREISRPVLQWEKSKNIKNGSEIYMLGYPMGLPEKLALNADVSNNSNFQYFYTSLDSFQGNSGSPVFNYETHKIIGILVSGMTDYELHGDCYKTTLCRQPDCPGEKAIRIELAFEN